MIKKAIYSLSTKTAKHNFGWLEEKHYWYGLAASLHFSKQIFERVEFITDDYGAEMATKFKLPFNYICNDLENLQLPKALWSLAKVQAIRLQDEPFLSIDGDVFLTKADTTLSPNFLKSAVCVQSYEPLDCYRFYTIGIKNFIDGGYELNDAFLWGYKNKIDPVNCGIVGGNDISLFRKYTDAVFEMIEMNWNRFGEVAQDWHCVTLEQWFLSTICKMEGIEPTVLLSNTFEHAGETGYKHWLSDSKRTEDKAKQVGWIVMNNMNQTFHAIRNHFSEQNKMQTT